MPGGILVCLLFLEAGAGMRLPLPSPRALDSEMTIVVLAIPVLLTVFPEGERVIEMQTHKHPSTLAVEESIDSDRFRSKHHI